MRSNCVRIDESYKKIAWAIGQARAVSGQSPADSLRAAVIFFNVTVSAMMRHVQDDFRLLSVFTLAITALNESINRRIREANIAYNGYLLDRIHRAHLDERHRIARDLHDRLGEGVSGALRQLELHELVEPDRPVEPRLHTSLAKGALTEAMDRLRLVILDLRRDSVTSLEKALGDYVISTATDVDVRLRISGDESWAPPTVIDEVFLIIREALRNALAHASPQVVLVRADLAPHELRAWVEDDGSGFDPRAVCTRISAGIASMRERAALVGGKLAISSSPGQGTQVELVVPLPGSPEGRPS
ncbi:MAG TPA: ATP-binding protein [Streptosporangiaceae bacterium]|nr:ATP-binding protein [Streptosporangiaceae bacterium]